ncbi:MAG TPA: macro domain-containing protein [Planctomycetota bacterium]|nr:macro domain-containing protein [Planctomycetota bacterium]
MDLEAIKAKIELREGDITEIEVDAIVNSANTDLILGAGVSGAIGRKGGKAIQEECDAIRSVPLGEAIVTTAGELKAKCIIHAVSMEIGHFTTEDNVALATRNALRRADERKLRTLAFPAIGTGAAALAPEYSARAMLETVAEHLAGGTGLDRIYFVLFKDEMLQAFREALDQLGTQRRTRRGRPG